MENKKKFPPDPELKLMDQVRQVLGYHHYSYRTEKTYCKKITRNNIYYQIFIGSKGEDRMKEYKWKEDFICELKENFHINPSTLYESNKFRLFGLPFFNNKNEYYLKFKESFNTL